LLPYSFSCNGGGGWISTFLCAFAPQVAFFPCAPNNALVAQTVAPPGRPRRGELPFSVFELLVLCFNFAFQVSLFEVCHA
jgi:hypothetical protein